MAKQVQFDAEIRNSLKRGVDIVANAVKVTIGPRGRNVALDRSWGTPVITNDGVSIAKEITLKDKFENMGAAIVKEVATKTNDKAGDGTTTAVVIAQAIIHEGLKRTALGANALVHETEQVELQVRFGAVFDGGLFHVLDVLGLVEAVAVDVLGERAVDEREGGRKLEGGDELRVSSVGVGIIAGREE